MTSIALITGANKGIGFDGPTGVLWGHVWTADGPGGYGLLPW